MWEIILTPEFTEWLDAQSGSARGKIADALGRLSERGPTLGRPLADTIKGSAVANLKELRVQVKGSPYRVFFAFDPIRRAVVLCGGDKTGDRRFYDRMIPVAESIYARHLANLDQETEG